MLDPALRADAEQFRLLLGSEMWDAYVRYLNEERDRALSRAMNQNDTDQNMHHWRGVYKGIVDALALPQTVIDHEKRLRDQEPPRPSAR